MNDAIVLKIVSELSSWNEKLKLKFVSQQFNRLVDESLSQTRRLVVFHRLPVLPDGQFKFTDDEYDSRDCLYITDLNKFFEANVKKLQHLEKLVIFSVNQGLCKLNFQLPRLQHLELYNLTITNPKLLSSPKLASFYNQDSVYRNCAPKFAVKKLNNLCISSEYFVGICPSLQEIDYLEIPENIVSLRLDPLIGLKARRIKINTDIKTAVDLCLKFECVERVDLNLTMAALNPFDLLFTTGYMLDDLEKFFEKKSKTALFILGAKVTRRNYRRLIDFLEEVVLPKLDVESNRMTLQIDCPCMLADLEANDELLGAFHALNEALVFEDLHLSNSLFNKFGNVKQIEMCLNSAERYNDRDPFDKFLLYFPKLNRLEIEVQPNVKLNNRFLDTIPEFCKNLTHLRVQCFDEVSFGFLSQLQKLKYLMVTTYHAWRHRVTSRLLKQLRYLSYFRLSFLKPENGFAKEDLSKYSLNS